MASLRDGIFSNKSDLDFVGEKLPPNVTHCFHAMALDERRKDFPITMLTSCQPMRLTQTWFRGSHSDVGGGNENLGVANISLCWIVCVLQNNIKFNDSVAWEQTEKGAVLQLKKRKGVLKAVGAKVYNSREGWGWRGKLVRTVGKGAENGDRSYSNSGESIHFSVRMIAEEAKRLDVQEWDRSEALMCFKWQERAKDQYYWRSTDNCLLGKSIELNESAGIGYDLLRIQKFLSSGVSNENETSGSGKGKAPDIPQSHPSNQPLLPANRIGRGSVSAPSPKPS